MLSIMESRRPSKTAQYGHVDVAKVLIQNGADVKAVPEKKDGTSRR